MKKIAFIGIKGLPSKGGAERVVEAIALRLCDQYDVSVYCSSKYTPAKFRMHRIKLLRVPTISGKYLHTPSLVILSSLHALFFGNYDLIHLHNAEISFVLPLLRMRYKIIATSHGPAYARAKWGLLAKVFMRGMDALFTLFGTSVTSVSHTMALYYSKRFKKRVEYIPNGVEINPNIDISAAMQLLKANNVNPKEYVLFVAGRIEPTKGCHLLLEAFREIDCKIPLLVVGDLDQVLSYKQNLLELADERTKFIPFISSKEVLFGLVKETRLFVFPSTVEAMSMMLLEAASLGVPILASDIPENTKVLDKYALFFKSGDVGDLRDKLLWALDNPEKMKQLAEGAKSWVLKNYSWDRIVKRYERLYEKVLRLS
ncbi:MAG: hypothetical protein DRG83_13360 [Deltaproteobacteria bacterium]|nr:MAG: hypothetical protein DRG83_13360 [Deltaproteobacteria bacterium]